VIRLQGKTKFSRPQLDMIESTKPVTHFTLRQGLENINLKWKGRKRRRRGKIVYKTSKLLNSTE
jgi:hypothetical protein